MLAEAGRSLVCEVDDDLTEALMGACKGSASSSTSRAGRETVAPARRLLTESMPSCRDTVFVINDSLNLSSLASLKRRRKKELPLWKTRQFNSVNITNKVE